MTNIANKTSKNRKHPVITLHAFITHKEVKTMEETKSNKPAHHYKFGAVRATIWREKRAAPGGKAFDAWSVVIDRTYKDAGGAWKTTSSLKENDIPKAIAALTRAYAYVCEKGGDEGDGSA